MKWLRRRIVTWLMPEIDRNLYRQLSRATPGTGKPLTAERTIGPNEVRPD